MAAAGPLPPVASPLSVLPFRATGGAAEVCPFRVSRCREGVGRIPKAFPWESSPIPAAVSAFVSGPVISFCLNVGPNPEKPEGGRIHPPQNTELLKALCMAQPFMMNSSLTVVADTHLAVTICQALFLALCACLSPWRFIPFLKVFIELVTILLLFCFLAERHVGS